MTINSDRSSRYKILLLEATPDSLSVVRTQWTDADVLVQNLNEAQGIADLISREKVQLVFCDLIQTDGPGHKVLRQVRRVHPNLPLVAVLPEQNFSLAIDAFRRGINDVLTHPLSEGALLEVGGRLARHAEEDAEQVRTQQLAKRSLDDLVLLKAIDETTRLAGDQQQLLDRIVDLIQSALGVEIVSLMLADEDESLKIRAACGLPDDVKNVVTVTPGEGVAGHVIATGEPVLIDDLSTDGRFAPRDGVARYRSGSLLSVPIRYQQQVLGVLNVNNKRNGEAFTATDQELLLMIAHQTALAIENMKLVSHLRAKNQELEKAHSDLMKLHQDRTRFVCNLSHELKTPLTSVLGYSDLLLNFFQQIEEPQLREYIRNIYDEGKHLEHLLTGMLRLFSIDSGSENWDWQNLSLQDKVGNILMQYDEQIADKEIVLDLAMPEETLELWSDPDKLDLLLNALIDNAVKFNRQGGRLSITAGHMTLMEKSVIYMQIYNEGVSVPRERADDIFQEYSQLGALDTGKPSGVGVGLATCRAILRQMGGEIFLEPREDEGTSLGLLLPSAKTTEIKKQGFEQ
jgi:K+-sensing histidine kinase KdpD